MIRKVFTTMKYRVINHTTLEIFETNSLASAHRWMADWKEMGYNVTFVVLR